MFGTILFQLKIYLSCNSVVIAACLVTLDCVCTIVLPQLCAKYYNFI